MYNFVNKCFTNSFVNKCITSLSDILYYLDLFKGILFVDKLRLLKVKIMTNKGYCLF